MNEWTAQFEGRKQDHLRIALDPQVQAGGHAGLERISLIHEAIPELNFEEIEISTSLFGKSLEAPFLISSMTAGHESGVEINRRIFSVAVKKKWAVAVGSQRRELVDQRAAAEWLKLRDQFPDLLVMGNIGISQAISASSEQIQNLVDHLQAQALFVHVNPLQESLQPEGTAHFKGALGTIRRLAKELSVPVLVKEVGCGFSVSTLERLRQSGIYGVDVAGLGGTHWGRVEGLRSSASQQTKAASEVFANWGISTAESLAEAVKLDLDYKLWASGGVRSGLDAAKLLAMGAEIVGFAQPILQAAVRGEDSLLELMSQLEYQLKIAMFCTGCGTISQLNKRGVWRWI